MTPRTGTLPSVAGAGVVAAPAQVETAVAARATVAAGTCRTTRTVAVHLSAPVSAWSVLRSLLLWLCSTKRDTLLRLML